LKITIILKTLTFSDIYKIKRKILNSEFSIFNYFSYLCRPNKHHLINMKNYKRFNNIIGWIVGIAACTVYVMTAERTASWWDCGEYIATAFKLQVGHPPGAPTFQLLGALFSLITLRDPMTAGFMVNVMSALASGFSILFLFWSITLLGKKLVLKYGEMTDSKMWMIFGSGIVGGMAYCFSDSFWFSAVEGEVYALSSFFTAITFWAILKWDEVADRPHHLRWIILISFLIGLAIGVHLLNLLVIPAVIFVIYYRKFKPSRKRFWYALGLSGVLLGVILWGIIPYIVSLAGQFELFFVNSLGLPFNSGSYFYFTLLIGGIAWGMWYSIKKHKVLLNTALLCLVFILVGYSTFFILVIRANAGTPINQNEPKNAYSLLDYLNREQYGQRPLVYGNYFTAELKRVDERSPRYVRDDEAGKYVKVSSNVKYTFDPAHCGLFPRMHSSLGERAPEHANYYRYFSGYDGRQIERENGRVEWSRKPTMAENVRFFVRYHLGWQYTRYFMWNFVGRQNDIQGRGFDPSGNPDVLNGNWISGIKFIDEARLGPQDNLPDFQKNNQGRNVYYFLPLILGLIGLYYQYKKDKQSSFVVFLLFFMTGIAIVMYLNQPSTEPRERDYSVVGSFYAFAIWIGFGVMAIAEYLQRKLKTNGVLAAGITTAVTFTAVPALMCQQNWDDHDRSHKSAARDFARNMLESCEPNAILICNGDNDTFPVWFAQEVEGVRLDVRVINSALAGSHWHIQPLYSKVYEADPVKFTLRRDQHALGTNERVFIDDRKVGRRELIELIRFVGNDNPNTKVRMQGGEQFNFLTTTQYTLTINRDRLLEKGIITPEQYPFTVAEMQHDIGASNWIFRSDLAFLDILATNDWERPIYVASPGAQRNVWPITQFAQLEGVVHRFVPYHNPNKNTTQMGLNGIATDKTYDLFMNKFTWGNLTHDKARIGPETRRSSEQHRMQFAYLAQALIADGKNDSAVQVLDRGLELFPHHKISFDQYVAIYVEAYFRAGNPERGLDLANRMVDIHENNLRYFERFPSKHRRFLDQHIQETIWVFRYLRYSLPEFEETCKDLFERLDRILESRGVRG
jgi:tetratricopeptide (TPR) repeat protein